MNTWTDPETWYKQLSSFYSAAAALITDRVGNVLLLKPTYRDYWTFPGGYTEQDEFPHDACGREVEEELGLRLQVGPLLVVDWAPPAHPRPRAIISFTFDCGVLPNHASLHLDTDEHERWEFLSPEEAARRLPGNQAPRVGAALDARRNQNTIYLAGGRYVLPREVLSTSPS